MALVKLEHGAIPTPATMERYQPLFDNEVPQLLSYCPTCDLPGHINDMPLDGGCPVCSGSLISITGIWTYDRTYWTYGYAWYTRSDLQRPLPTPEPLYPRDELISIYSTIYAGMTASRYPYSHDEKHAIALRQGKLALDDLLKCTQDPSTNITLRPTNPMIDAEIIQYMDKAGIELTGRR